MAPFDEAADEDAEALREGMRQAEAEVEEVVQVLAVAPPCANLALPKLTVR
jgi:hypothetical protein